MSSLSTWIASLFAAPYEVSVSDVTFLSSFVALFSLDIFVSNSFLLSAISFFNAVYSFVKANVLASTFLAVATLSVLMVATSPVLVPISLLSVFY